MKHRVLVSYLLSLVLVAIFGVTLLGAIIGASRWLLEENCRATAEQMLVPYEYHFKTGCMIQPEQGVWVPLSSYRYIGEQW